MVTGGGEREEIRIRLPLPVDVVGRLGLAIAREWPDARIRTDPDDLVITVPMYDDDDEDPEDDLERWREFALDMMNGEGVLSDELVDLWRGIVDVLNRAVDGDSQALEAVPAIGEFVDRAREIHGRNDR